MAPDTESGRNDVTSCGPPWGLDVSVSGASPAAPTSWGCSSALDGAPTAVAAGRVREGRVKRRGDEPGNDGPGTPVLERAQIIRHADSILIGSQLRCDLRIPDGPAQDVDEVEAGQKEARNHRRRIELDDRLPSHRRVDDQHDGRRN